MSQRGRQMQCYILEIEYLLERSKCRLHMYDKTMWSLEMKRICQNTCSNHSCFPCWCSIGALVATSVIHKTSTPVVTVASLRYECLLSRSKPLVNSAAPRECYVALTFPEVREERFRWEKGASGTNKTLSAKTRRLCRRAERACGAVYRAPLASVLTIKHDIFSGRWDVSF